MGMLPPDCHPDLFRNARVVYRPLDENRCKYQCNLMPKTKR
jgi:hypothetical protein